jgi:hypothetical protein
MHPMVRALVLVPLAQILRPTGAKLGVEPKLVQALVGDLRHRSRRAWGQPASFALSIAGAALGALLAGGAALVGLASGGKNEANAYSYLFSARQDFYW